MKKAIFILLAISILFSCNRKKNDSDRIMYSYKNIKTAGYAGKSSIASVNKGKGTVIDLSHIRPDETIHLSEFVKKISFVKLENGEKSLIGDIDKLELKDDFLYVLDRHKMKTLKKFHKTGSYVCSYGTIGAGPEEQQEITDFYVTEGKVIIWDKFKSKFFFYDKNGNLLYSKFVPYLFRSFYLFDENNYIVHSLDADNYHLPEILGYSILQTDSNFVVHKKGAYREKDKYFLFTARNNMIAVNNHLYYHEPLNDTIFSIDRNGNMYCDYILNFGKLGLPAKLLLKENENRMKKSLDSQSASFLGDYVPLEDYLYACFVMKGSIYHVIYSESSQQILCGNRSMDDFFYCFRLNFNIIAGVGNTLISYEQAYVLSDIYKSQPKAEWLKRVNNPDFISFMEDLTEEDNPVIVFYELDNQNFKSKK